MRSSRRVLTPSLRSVLPLIALALPLSVARANDAPVYLSQSEAFGLVKHVRLAVDDQVSGGCWTNSNANRAKLRLLFEQNGIAVYDEEMAFYTSSTALVLIRGVGYRTNSLCVIAAELEVSTVASQKIGGIDGGPEFSVTYDAFLFRASQIMSSGNNNNGQMADFFEASASDFIADVLSARRSAKVEQVFEAFPRLGEKAPTTSEFEAFFEQAGGN